MLDFQTWPFVSRSWQCAKVGAYQFTPNGGCALQDLTIFHVNCLAMRTCWCLSVTTHWWLDSPGFGKMWVPHTLFMFQGWCSSINSQFWLGSAWGFQWWALQGLGSVVAMALCRSQGWCLSVNTQWWMDYAGFSNFHFHICKGLCLSVHTHWRLD